MPLKPRNSVTITSMLSLTFLALFFSGLLQFPSLSTPLPSFRNRPSSLAPIPRRTRSPTYSPHTRNGIPRFCEGSAETGAICRR
ncbi:hypothetical protein CRG98_044858 [Punica granatum]|uniref:Uncharacterized protein n=1 Tax=Punica granatum TaxID=22663 RepID=A0A2I0HST8_PUNGR|nr:hypothetical protein CRG98_044858 [Punica granatum]